ncbi:MAG: Holliday junction resolvase RecU [bacterium]
MAGRKSQQSGEVFEKHLRYICNILRNKGIADIRKNPVEKKLIYDSRLRKQRLVYAEKQTVDFEGFYFGNGKHIAFDAKHKQNAKNSWTYSNKHKQFHQTRYLYNVWKSGGTAFLLLWVSGDRIVKVLPNESWDMADSIKIVFNKHIVFEYNQLENFLEI